MAKCLWFRAISDAEERYFQLLECGCKPEEARMVLPNIYSIRADQTSGQIFLKTDINPDLTICLNSGLTSSIILKATGYSISEGLM